MAKMKEEMLSRQVGPTFGVVKLRPPPGVRRTKDGVTEITVKWAKVLKTGAVDVNFMGIDLNTIMFTLMRGRDTIEVREFLLEQPNAYEIKIGERIFRRPGDPPREEASAGERNSSHYQRREASKGRVIDSLLRRSSLFNKAKSEDGR